MKRIISLLMAAILVLSLIPVSAPIPAKAAGNARYCVLVLDISGSVTFTSGYEQIYKAETAVEYVKSAAVSFLKDVGMASGDNYVAVVTYEEYADVVSGFTDDMDTLADQVNEITQADYRGRSIAAGLETAQELLDEIDDPNATKNVILFTTGMTNKGEYDYDGVYNDNTVGSSWGDSETDVKLYAYANQAYVYAQKLKESATVYTLGLFQVLENMPEAGKEVAEFFRMTARNLASAENCFYDVTDPSQLEFAFSEIAGDITATEYNFKYAGMIYGQGDKKDTASQCYYTDDYFLKRSSLYNTSLATMSLCLELSCWSSHEQENWYDPEIEPNNTKFWKDKLVNVKSLLVGNPEKYENYTGEMGLGFDHFSANEYWEAIPQQNSIGVCAARKQIQSRNGKEQYTLVAVVIRGGGYGSEWGSNLEVGSSGDHKGFSEARNNVLTFLEGYLKNLGREESEKLKLWIVGYSRAGAVANMVAGTLNDDLDRLGYTIDRENIFCYTFEAPQGVHESNLYSSYENIHNVINANDLVPLVAPSSWGFYRYNHTAPHYLPSRYITNEKTFQQQIDAMYRQLEEMGFSEHEMLAAGKDFKYSIEEYTYRKKIYIDKSRVFSYGEPLWWWEESKVSTHQALDDFVDLLAEDVLLNRAFYADNLEYCVSTALAILRHYDGVAAGADVFLKDNLSDEDILRMFKEFFTVEHVMYIIAPAFSPNIFKNVDDRKEEVTDRALEVLAEVFEPLGEVDKAINALGTILSHVLWTLAEDVWNNNTDSINTVLLAVDVLTTIRFQPHYPEITLAWCRSLDPNYNKDVAKDQGSAVTRVVRINCPVNVYVYDMDGNVVASIVDDIPSDESLLVCYTNSNGEKILYLPGDTSYNIEIIATDNGTVSYCVSEHSLVYGDLVSSRSYNDIPVSEGEYLIASVGAASSNSLQENSQYGTDAQYTLSNDWYVLDPDTYFTGEAARKKYDIVVQTEGTGGYAIGSGSFHAGSYAKVEAYTLPGGEFLGWYNEYGDLLFEDTVYRFAVRDGSKVVARFSDVDYYDLELNAAKGGSIQGLAGAYCQGMEISLVAVPKPGYRFAGWTTSAGILSDKSSPETTLIMPGENVSVKAKFEPLEDTTDKVKQSSGPMVVLIGGTMILLGILCLVLGIRLAVKRKNNG